MSTNAEISVVHKDQTVSTVYLHWDGDGALATLQEAYNTLEKAEALVALGSLSALYTLMDAPAGHTFAKPVDGVTIAYHRDRGEDLKVDKDDSVEECLRNCGQQYHYMFEFSKWQRVTMDDLAELMGDE